MPEFVKTKKDHEIWNRAKEEFKKSYKRYPQTSNEWAIVTKIFFNIKSKEK